MKLTGRDLVFERLVQTPVALLQLTSRHCVPEVPERFMQGMHLLQGCRTQLVHTMHMCLLKHSRHVLAGRCVHGTWNTTV